MNPLLRRLGLSEISPFFDECYEAALQEPGLPIWLTEEFVRETAAVTPILTTNLEAAVAAIPAVTANADLLLFAKILHRMLGNRQHHEIVFPGLAFPKAPEGQDPLGWDMCPLYPMLARIRETYEQMCTGKLPKDILEATFSGVNGSISASFRLAGRHAFIPLYFLWCTTYSTGALYRLNNFTCELRSDIRLPIRAFQNAEGVLVLLADTGVKFHRNGRLLGAAGATDPEGAFTAEYRETEDCYEGYTVDGAKGLGSSAVLSLPKSQWTPIYTPGDVLVSLHIPKSQSFAPEALEEAFREVEDFFGSVLSERNAKGCVCVSWLLAPELQDILRPTANILGFQSRFVKFPSMSNGLEVFVFVFDRAISSLSEVNLEELPENTSLAKSLKALYLQGHYLCETGGFRPFSLKA
jgi:hypothetical protein